MFFDKKPSKLEDKEIKDKYGVPNLHISVTFAPYTNQILERRVPGQRVIFTDNIDNFLNAYKHDQAPERVYVSYSKPSTEMNTIIFGTDVRLEELITGYREEDGMPLYDKDKILQKDKEIEEKRQSPTPELYQQVAQYKLGQYGNLTHNVAIVIDNSDKKIYYIDSYGEPISDDLKAKFQAKFNDYEIKSSTQNQQHPEDHCNCALFATENLSILARSKTDLGSTPSLFNPMSTGYIETIDSIRKEYGDLIKDELRAELDAYQKPEYPSGKKY